MDTDIYLPQKGTKGANARIRIYAVVSGGSNSPHQQPVVNWNICRRTGSVAISLAGHSYASSSVITLGLRASHCSRSPSLVNRKMDGTAPTVMTYPAKRISRPMAARLTKRRLKRGIAIRKAVPDDGGVVIKGVIDAFNPHQWNERHVNDHYLLRQIGPVVTIVSCPGNRSDAQNVERQPYRQPQRRQLDAARDTSLFERRFHSAWLNIRPTHFCANLI
jgi:hypothetical protein